MRIDSPVHPLSQFLRLFLLVTMSNAPKRSKSGLLSVTRDFSSNSTTPSSTQDTMTSSVDSAAIPWTSSTTTPALPSQRRSIESMSQRIKVTQDAPIGRYLARSTPPSSASQSRPVFPAVQSAPKTKKRQLPSAWQGSETTASRTLSASHPLKRIRTTDSFATKTITTPTSTSDSILLSEEQKHILQLVEAGHSVFYTGSAGECTLWSMIGYMRKQFALRYPGVLHRRMSSSKRLATLHVYAPLLMHICIPF